MAHSTAEKRAMDDNDYDSVLRAIARGIVEARENPLPETEDADRYAAWIALQHLRRDGWRIIRGSD
jgi:hypothetical protein